MDSVLGREEGGRPEGYIILITQGQGETWSAHTAHEFRLESRRVWLFTLYMDRLWGVPEAAVMHRGFKGLIPGEHVGRRTPCCLQP